jgi:ABC-2 type transport system ATP-binding protein
MSEILVVNHLDKKFRRIYAVKDISFTVDKGNVYGILGPNGSGKSTTLCMLLGTINASGGNWQWFGNPGTTSKTLQRIGAIIEQPNFYSYLSAEQNLKIVAKIKHVDFQRIDDKLALVGLLERKNDKYASFSLGMKQRLAIASALLSDPEVLILDEPTNGLDPEGIIQIRELIVKIARGGTTILLASHLLDEVEKVCSHVIILKEGKSLYCGPVNKLLSPHGILEIGAKDLKKLIAHFEHFSAFGAIKTLGDIIEVELIEQVDTSLVNTYFMQQGIALTHLVKRNQKLEQQFIDLVKDA